MQFDIAGLQISTGHWTLSGQILPLSNQSYGSNLPI
jgi:hypothetical protein